MNATNRTLTATFLAGAFLTGAIYLLAFRSNLSHAEDKTPPDMRGMLGSVTIDGTSRAGLGTRISKAGNVYRRFIHLQGMNPALQELQRRSSCIGIIPEAKVGGMLNDDLRGNGVISCRTSYRSWSPPSFVTLSRTRAKVSYSAESDFILFFADEGARQAVLRKQVTLGVDIPAHAGPASKGAQPSAYSGVYAYVMSQAGTAVTGRMPGAFVLTQNTIGNQVYYGEKTQAKQLLGDSRNFRHTDEVKSLINLLRGPMVMESLTDL